MVIYGYRINSTDINEIMSSLDKVRGKIARITEREYNRLLSEEITFLVDKVSLNEIQRANDISIYDGAVQNVNERVNRDETLNSNTPYNFRIFVHVLTEGEYTYLKVNCQNNILIKAFDGLEDYSLNEIECEDQHNAKTILWQKLHKKYKNVEPMVISLTQAAAPDKSKLKFASVKLRAEAEATHSILNRLLSEISGGREIPPIRLMDYLDEALQTFEHSENVKKDYSDCLSRLIGILPDLTKDYSFIFDIPGAPKVIEIPDNTNNE